jgi:hypothetical protein
MTRNYTAHSIKVVIIFFLLNWVFLKLPYTLMLVIIFVVRVLISSHTRHPTEFWFKATTGIYFKLGL